MSYNKLDVALYRTQVYKIGTNANCITCGPNLENLAGEITQVTDSIPWVRCASGNVLVFDPNFKLKLGT